MKLAFYARTSEPKAPLKVSPSGGLKMRKMMNDQRNPTIIETARNFAPSSDWRRLSGPLLSALAIVLAAIVGVEEFDLSAGWAGISAAAGVALAGLWLI
jgi:hypothetical protein